MTEPNQPNITDSNQTRLQEILGQLSLAQIRFIVARNETKSDKDAAEMIGISPGYVKQWNVDGSKALIDEALVLMAHDGVITALEIRRRNLAKAMAVKAAALDSDNEKIRQDAATEIIEWELGKATQRSELTGKDGGAIPLEVYQKALDKVYGDPDSQS
jgi:hypothetical protein